MSENVGSSGIMVPLTTKMSDEEREEISEAIWDSGNSLVQINYEGTIAYTNHESDGYGIEFGVTADTNDLDYIRTIMEHYGFGIVEEQARPYSCYWYNGADSDMDMLELEDFLVRTGQEGQPLRPNPSKKLKYSIESFEDGYILYYGRSNNDHGYNLGHVVNPAFNFCPRHIEKLLNLGNEVYSKNPDGGYIAE